MRHATTGLAQARLWDDPRPASGHAAVPHQRYLLTTSTFLVMGQRVSSGCAGTNESKHRSKMKLILFDTTTAFS
jgi:hypothetical protein